MSQLTGPGAPRTEGGAAARYRSVMRLPPTRSTPAPIHFKRYLTSHRRPLPWRPGERSGREPAELLTALFRPYAPTRLHYADAAGAQSLLGAAFRPGSAGSARELQLAGIRRPVPSGGAVYPVELYAAVPGDTRLPAGVYHYEASGHTVEWIRSGEPSRQLRQATAGPEAPAGALLLAARRWKGAGKYGNLCYHLTALDLGVVVGQVLTEPPAPVRVSFYFVDDLLDDLLGVAPEVETVFAAMLLEGPGRPAGPSRSRRPPPPAVGLERDWACRSMVDPVVVELDAASRITGQSHLPSTPVVAGPPRPAAGTAVTIPLPTPGALPDLEPADRRSAVAFSPRPIRLDQLATVLAEATRGYPSDVAGTAEGDPPVGLYWVTSGMAGLAEGSYRYVPAAHVAELRRAVAPEPRLRAAVTGLDPHLVSASLSLFLVGGYGSDAIATGDRWYRVANMLAGVMLLRICRAAAALGLGSRPHLGFHPAAVGTLLRLAPDEAPLVQVMVGHPAPRSGCLDLWLPDPGR